MLYVELQRSVLELRHLGTHRLSSFCVGARRDHLMRDLNWGGIVFGAAAGLVTSYILFAVGGAPGASILGKLAIQLIGFVAAGYVAARFSLVQGTTAGAVASLALFFVVAGASIAAGAGANIAGLSVLGVLAIIGGSLGSAIAEKTRRT